MCHGAAIASFPTPDAGTTFRNEVAGLRFGDPDAATRLAILPDIYGCNPFYRGLATRYARLGAAVYLIDTFDGLGELPEVTREAAFARRAKVKDRTFLDSFLAFARAQAITGTVGFCLGGLYIFELARREADMALIGLYGFPQGLPNQDPLPVPFDYLDTVTRNFTMLMGREDEAVGRDNIERLKAAGRGHAAMNLKIYDDVGHNFLPLLDSNDPAQRAIAEDALSICDEVLLGGPPAMT